MVAAVVARRDPDVILVQALPGRQDMEALDAVLTGYEIFYIGKDQNAPLDYFGAVIWLRREGFVLDARTYYHFLTPDGTPNTSFAESQELNALVTASFRDCRSDILYYWQNTLLERSPAVQQKSLEVMGSWSWGSPGASRPVAGAFGITPTDPLYPQLLSPPDAREIPANTLDLAETRDTLAVPNVDLQALSDHVLVNTRYSQWRVPRWTLETMEHAGQRITDHAPLWIILQEQQTHRAQEFIPERESCRNKDAGGG